MADTREEIKGGLYAARFTHKTLQQSQFGYRCAVDWPQLTLGKILVRSQATAAPESAEFERFEIQAAFFAAVYPGSGRFLPTLYFCGTAPLVGEYRPPTKWDFWTDDVIGTFDLGARVGMWWEVAQPPLMTFELGAKVGIVWDTVPQLIGTFEFGLKAGFRWSTTVSEPFSFGCRVGMSFIGEVKKAPTVQFGARAGVSWAPRLGTPQTCLTGDGAPPPAPEETRNYVF